MAVPEIRDRLLFPKENQTEEEPKLENNHQEAPLPPEQECPRCQSRNTKFCYFNNRCILQPRHYCKDCKRHWTLGGILRDVPLRGKRRNRKPYEVPTSANISCNQQEKTPCQQINSPTGFTAALSSASLRNDGASSSLIPMATTSAKNFPRSGILFPCQALQPLGHPINCEGNDFSLLQGSDVPVFSVQQPQQRHQHNQGFHLPVFTLHQPQQHHQIYQSSLVQSLHQMQNGEGNAFSLLQGSTQPFHNLRQPHQRLQLNQNDRTLVCPLPIVHPLHQPIDGQVSGFSLLQGPSQPVLPFHQHSQHPQGDWPLMCPLPAVQPLHSGSNCELNGFRPSQRPSESVHLLQQHRRTNAGSTGLGPF